MSRTLGTEIENFAYKYLFSHHLSLVTRNYHCRHGEIDLVMLDKTTLVFIEVRYRKNSTYGYPIESIDNKKQYKIYQAALDFISHNPKFKNTQYRFDVVTLLGNIEKIRKIFTNFEHSPVLNTKFKPTLKPPSSSTLEFTQNSNHIDYINWYKNIITEDLIKPWI